MGDGAVVRPDQVSLGVLVSSVPRDVIDAAVDTCDVGAKRSGGKLPPHVILSCPDDHGCDLGGCVEDSVLDAGHVRGGVWSNCGRYAGLSWMKLASSLGS